MRGARSSDAGAPSGSPECSGPDIDASSTVAVDVASSAEVTDAAAPVVVRPSAGVHVFLWTVLPAGGAAVGLGLALLPGWMAGLPRLRGLDLLTGLAEALGVWSSVALLLVGAVVGGVFALQAYDEIATVEVGDGSVVIRRGGDDVVVARSAVAGASVVGKELVLVGPDGAERFRGRTELEPARLRAAFEARGWRWDLGGGGPLGLAA